MTALPGGSVNGNPPQPPHPRVMHAMDWRNLKHLNGSRVRRVNDWIVTHLALAFGSIWVIWVFFIWPLLAAHLGMDIKLTTEYYTGSWIQLFALPLFVYIGNKLQRSDDAAADTMHEALTHIANVEDQNNELLRQNTEITEQVHQLAKEIHERIPVP